MPLHETKFTRDSAQKDDIIPSSIQKDRKRSFNVLEGQRNIDLKKDDEANHIAASPSNEADEDDSLLKALEAEFEQYDAADEPSNLLEEQQKTDLAGEKAHKKAKIDEEEGISLQKIDYANFIVGYSPIRKRLNRIERSNIPQDIEETAKLKAEKEKFISIGSIVKNGTREGYDALVEIRDDPNSSYHAKSAAIGLLYKMVKNSE